ncbi:MAG: hypothetical protein ACR2JU_00055 [Nocardioidaceae bacterium]
MFLSIGYLLASIDRAGSFQVQRPTVNVAVPENPHTVETAGGRGMRPQIRET